jgi:predicted naringenin-chalcone synthase
VVAKASRLERRSELRTIVNEPAILQSLSPLLLESFDVQVVDVSKGGISVQLSRHLPAQSEVKIRRGAAILFGEVRYCVPARGGFRAGIKIKETI